MTTPVPPSSPFRAPIGTSDFRKVRTEGLTYVDKSDFVAGVVTATDEVLLFPRPRRFGKSLNMAALRCFVEKGAEDVRPLFAGLAIEQRAEAWAHFQRYPVIFMTFKDVKARTFANAREAIRHEIAAAYEAHRYLLDSDVLSPPQREAFLEIVHKRGHDGVYWRALHELSAHLHAYHGERVAILIDEYDLPIQAGFTARYYGEVVEFFSNFLSGGLKDNPHLWKGVLTGVLRVAKESIFSGLNNLTVYSVLSSAFATSFGFTPAEVEALAGSAGRTALLPRMKRWYDGYRFGGEVLYNPWSVLGCLASAEPDPLQSYWVGTSSLDLVRDLLLARAGEEEQDIETLLRGKSIKKRIDENVALRDLSADGDAVWGILLFSGYLTATRIRRVGGEKEVRLAIPNREVRVAYRTLFKDWLSRAAGGDVEVRALGRALLAGRADKAESLLQTLLVRAMSFHDTGKGPGAPERVYHAFLLGLLVWLGPRYRVSSNREAGHGRCDITIVPRDAGKPGVVMELKTVDKAKRETMAKAMKSALGQLRTRDYAAELRAVGASPVWEIGVVFDGKRVKVAVAPG